MRIIKKRMGIIKEIPVMFSCLLASIFVLYTVIRLGLVPVVQVCLCLLLMLRGQSVYI